MTAAMANDLFKILHSKTDGYKKPLSVNRRFASILETAGRLLGGGEIVPSVVYTVVNLGTEVPTMMEIDGTLTDSGLDPMDRRIRR